MKIKRSLPPISSVNFTTQVNFTSVNVRKKSRHERTHCMILSVQGWEVRTNCSPRSQTQAGRPSLGGSTWAGRALGALLPSEWCHEHVCSVKTDPGTADGLSLFLYVHYTPVKMQTRHRTVKKKHRVVPSPPNSPGPLCSPPPAHPPPRQPLLCLPSLQRYLFPNVLCAIARVYHSLFTLSPVGGH